MTPDRSLARGGSAPQHLDSRTIQACSRDSGLNRCLLQAGDAANRLKPERPLVVYDSGGTWGGNDMRRREFITLLGGAAAAWPLDKERAAARADATGRGAHACDFGRAGIAGPDRGILARAAGSGVVRRPQRTHRDPLEHWRCLAPAQGCGRTSRARPGRCAGWSRATIPALLEASRTVPVVFAQGLDPVGAGFVESLARPGGNATGFTQFEYSLSGKWLEMLKEVAPALTRAAGLREGGPAGIGQWAIIQAVAQSSGVELSPINLRDASETERAVTAFAGSPNGGLIVIVSRLRKFIAS